VAPSTEAHLAAVTTRLPEGVVVPVVERSARGFRIIAAAARGDLRAALDAVIHATGDIYIGSCGLDATKVVELRRGNKRGGQEHARALLGVFADIDIAGPNHKTDKPLPRTLQDALAVLTGLPVPTMIVHTGGGIHVWWLFDTPLQITDTNRDQVKVLADGWVRTVAHHAQWLGFEIDAGVGDLARVLRLSGTTNLKQPDNAQRIRLLDPVETDALGTKVSDWPTGGLVEHGWAWRPDAVYTPELIALHLDPLPPPTPIRPRTTTSRPADDGGHLNILEACNAAAWGELWPEGWTFVGTASVAGQAVERWRRPGALSPHSVVCWPNGGCHVFSDNVAGLPPGGHSKADVLAWREHLTLGELARLLITEARKALR
jgi:hypothetical protein